MAKLLEKLFIFWAVVLILIAIAAHSQGAVLIDNYRYKAAVVTQTYLGAQLISNDLGIGNPTFSAFNAGSNGIGAADATRQIVVIIYSLGVVVNSAPASMTIGGVSASLLTSTTNGTDNIGIRMYKASVPTGTTASIAVTWSDSQGARAYIQVYSVLNANTTVYNTATPDSTLSGELLSTTVNTIDGGSVIAGAYGRTSSGSPTWTWGNVTEDVEANMGGAYAAFGSTSASLTPSTTTTLTVNNTQTGASSVANSQGLIAVSFQPL